MTKIYIFAAIALFFIMSSAYWAGARMAEQRCRADNAIYNTTQNDYVHKKIIETKRIVNETVITTGTNDIRMRLRDKYTIGN